MKILKDTVSKRGIPLPWNYKILLPLAFFLVAGNLVFQREYVCLKFVGREYPDEYPIAHGMMDHYTNAVKDVINDQTAYGNHTHAYRAQHGKGHGCVKAEFVVDEQLSPRLRYGLFSKERSRYPAYIRFSTSQDPTYPDYFTMPRGMAIKLMGVKGPKMMNNAEYSEQDTHDFLLVSSGT
jgi:hypothetical protein